MKFYDSYGFFSFGDGYLRVKGNHPCHYYFIPHYSCLVMLKNVNGQNWHLCKCMIHMASFFWGWIPFVKRLLSMLSLFHSPLFLPSYAQ